MGLVRALWVAGFDAHLPNGTHLIPGVTEVEIGADEARQSDHWKPLKGKQQVQPEEGDE